MAIRANFINEPPSTITGPFEFSVEATNNGNVSDDFSFEAVLINPATGEQEAKLWSTNVWMPAGETKELRFQLAGTRELSVPDGTYDLQVLYGDYPIPTNWKSATNTTVEVSQQSAPPSDGGDGDGGDIIDTITEAATDPADTIEDVVDDAPSLSPASPCRSMSATR